MITTDPLTTLLADIDSKQRLIAKLVGAWPDADWLTPANSIHESFNGVRSRGHFVGRESQLCWSPAQVVGHIVAASHIGAVQIEMIRESAAEILPVLSDDFVDPIDDRQTAMRDLGESQQRLLFSAAAADARDLGLTGQRTHRRVTLRDTLLGIADHDADHAHQLVILLGRN